MTKFIQNGEALKVQAGPSKSLRALFLMISFNAAAHGIDHKEIRRRVEKAQAIWDLHCLRKAGGNVQ